MCNVDGTVFQPENLLYENTSENAQLKIGQFNLKHNVRNTMYLITVVLTSLIVT